jgi:hypothetical protein
MTWRAKLLAICVLIAAGASPRAAEADTICAMGTLATYIGQSCSILGFTFSGFSYVAGGTEPRSAASLLVMPQVVPSQGATIVAFDFLDFGSVTGTDTTNATIGFTAAFPPPRLEEAIGLAFASSHSGNASASVDLAASMCHLHGVNVVSTGCNLSPAVPAVDVTMQIQLAAKGGSVTVPKIHVQFAEVPEPWSVALTGTGLLGVAWLGRRRAVSSRRGSVAWLAGHASLS